MACTANGGLRVTFDRGEVGVPAAGAYTVAFPEETVTPWLSAFGQRVQRQTVTPSRSLDLGAAHIPETATLPLSPLPDNHGSIAIGRVRQTHHRPPLE
ncbi:hypothetical protein [Streptomyces swartbergensis]|uniref:Uncharacterized protein n=1 Tax=Streptomyces swartbergensis TaxID=487165 RepID=A0A243S8K7_9ACTN|nr:hypothetical protein [Streptomyces swartbergensis]OUD03982.1 hypothetical protein CA983_06550 [Streptomyces swartbergensis]